MAVCVLFDAFTEAASGVAAGAAEVRRAPGDAVSLHDLRVSLRRARSLLRAYGDSVDPEWRDSTAAEIRALSAPFGPARDVDVFIGNLAKRASRFDPLDRHGLDDLVTLTRRERQSAYRAVRHVLKDPRWRALEASLLSPRIGHQQSPDEVAALLAGRWHKLRKLVRSHRDDTDEHRLHEVRVSVKQFRYSLDAAAIVLGPVAAAHASELGRVQDELGTIHDAAVSCARLRQIAGEIPALGLVAGQLIAFNRSDSKEAIERWPRRWEKASRDQLLTWRD